MPLYSDMRFGIFGDVHSNLEALEAVLEDMQGQAVTHPLCIGDIVGYNANPRECLEIIRALDCPIVKGNHDQEAGQPSTVERFNDLALASIRYSREQLTLEQKEFLCGLPLVRPIGEFSMVHATLHQPHNWRYVFNATDAQASFEWQQTAICFFGHTHVPHVYVRDAAVHQFLYKKIHVHPHKRYFINVGSVGQPRDGDWRAAYVIFDTNAKTIELRRIPYDLAKTQAKIIKAGLPSRLAERLANAA